MGHVLKLLSPNCPKNCSLVVCLSMFLGMIAALMPADSRAQDVVAKPPYSVSTFATAPAGLSAPDSLTFSSTHVFVGYGNGGSPVGSGGAMSNIIEYDFNGNEIRNFPIVGHNDGLRFNPRTNELWALQNEDGNSTLIILNPETGEQRLYHLCKGSPCTGPHGGGYDDIDFNEGRIYISASAPTLMPDSAPAIVSLKLKGEEVVLTGIINGNAKVTNVRTGRKVTLNLTDPDSMVVDPFGELVMTSQGDGELIIVQHPGRGCQNSFVVPVSSALGGRTTGNTQLDDTVFTSRSPGMLLIADKGLNAIYEITAPYFGPGAYSAVSVFSTPTAPNPIASFVGRTNLTTGFITPIVIGMSNPGGMAFIPSDVNLENFIDESVRIPDGCPKK
jgi:hypothetical protein